MKYIKLFDKDHVILDELHEYNSLIHGFALNALGKCSFNVPLESIKCTQANFQAFNCIEVWEDGKCLWWGVIAFAVPSRSVLNAMCYGYLYVLQKTVAWGGIVSVQLQALIASDVSIFNIRSERLNTSRPNLTMGHSEDNTLMLNGVTLVDEDYYKRFQTICMGYNFDFDVDADFKFNYYRRRGEDKPHYSVNYGTEADNVAGDPSFNVDTTGMANELVYEGSVMAKDTVSQGIYGKITAVSQVKLSDAGDIQNYINAELQRTAYPSVSIQATIVDSALCPFNDIEIGDKVIANFPTYWGFSELMRIIEINFDDMTGKCTLNLGNVIYRQQPPQQKLYMR